MKRVIRNIAQQLLPERLFSQLTSVTSRNYQHRFLKEHGLDIITEKVVMEYGLNVLHGPFQGMIYPQNSLISRHGIPKLLGSYEQELHPVLLDVIANSEQYDSFIDIGCAEGYYAVGLAMTTGRTVRAFDPEPRERAFCRDMASLNMVADKVVLHKWCDVDYLTSLAGKRCFVLSDCEGYEDQLFVANSIASLTRCDLLIELHDVDGKDMHAALSSRFTETHEMLTISARTPDPGEYSELEFLNGDAVKAISEYRNPEQKWLYLKARL